MVESGRNKFFQEFEVILQTKIGWNVVYKKLRIEKPLNNQVVKCSNNERYSASTGRQIGTSTPDYIYRLTDVDEMGVSYLEKYKIYRAMCEAIANNCEKA